jgi:hypothetical protein
MKKGPPLTKQKEKAKSDNKILQQELNIRSGKLFTKSFQVDSAAASELLSFLNRVNLDELNFNEEISVGPCKAAPILGVFALAASYGHPECANYVIARSDLKNLNFNKQCSSTPPFTTGVTVLFLLVYATAYEYNVCLERLFDKIPLKQLNFKAKCLEGPFKGTDVFWMIALAAVHGHRQYLEKLLNKVPISDLNFDIVCQRSRRAVCVGQLNQPTLISASASKPTEIDEPYSGDSTLHLLAEVAAQNYPFYLKTVLKKIALTAELLNRKILEGPNTGITVFHFIAEAEARTHTQLGLVEEISNNVLMQLDLNSVAEAGVSAGTTPLYWLAFAAGHGNPNGLKRILNRKTPSQLNLKIVGLNGAYKNTPILVWLAMATYYGEENCLEKLLANKAYTTNDFVIKNGFGVMPLYFLAKAATRGFNKTFDKVFNQLTFEDLDINAKYNETEGKGTTLLWMIAYLAYLGKAQYLEKLLIHIPIEKWDLYAFCESGNNEGWSVLHLIAEAAIKATSQVLLLILTKFSTLKLNLMHRIDRGQNKGLSLFQQICQAANAGNSQYLEFVLNNEELLRQAKFNTPCEDGVYMGTTPLWWICAATIKFPTEQLERILLTIPITELDFHATSKKSLNKRVSAFQLILRSAARGKKKPLEILFNQLNLNQIRYNDPIKERNLRGVTTLWWLCLLAATGSPEFLEKVLDCVPISDLDFILPCIEGEYKSITPFIWVAMATKFGNSRCLDKILSLISLKQLNRNASREDGHKIGFDILLFLAGREVTTIIESYLNEVPLSEIDMNFKLTSGTFKSPSLLWWFAYFAAKGQPACLKKVLAEVSLDLLDFNAVNEETGKTLRQVISGTPWESYVEVLSCLQNISALMDQPENLRKQLEQLDRLAEKAQADNHIDTYYVLARFFQGYQNEELFSKYATLVPKDHPCSRDITLELDNIIERLSDRLNILLINEEKSAPHPTHVKEITTELDSQKNSSRTSSTDLVNRASSRFYPSTTSLFFSSFSIDINTVEIQKKGEWRSEEAKRLHSLVMRAINAKTSEHFNQLLEKLDHCLSACSPDTLVEVSINGYSHLDDVLHLPFVRQKDILFAEYISNTLFSGITKEMQSKLPREQFAQIISNRTSNGFVLLQDALRSGSIANTKMVIALSENTLEKHVWRSILMTKNHYGYNGFQQAVSSGKFELVKVFMEAMLNAFVEESEPALREVSRESWRYVNSSSWKGSPEQMQIKALIEPFVTFRRNLFSPQR